MDSRSIGFVEKIHLLTGGAGVDLVLNSLSGDLLLGGLECVARGGLFLELGKRDILGGGSLPFAAFSRGIGFVAIELSPELPAYRGVVEALMGTLAQGGLAPLPCKIFPLQEAGEAFQFMRTARHIGKVVLAPDPARARRCLLGGKGVEAPFQDDAGLSDEDGLHLLQLALCLPEAQIVVSTDGNPLRSALTAPPVVAESYASSAHASNGVAESGDIGSVLAVIWCEALGLDHVGPDENFFDLLGDSLLAIDVLAKIRTQLNIALPPSTLFSAPTIRALTELLESKSVKTEATSVSVEEAKPVVSSAVAVPHVGSSVSVESPSVPQVLHKSIVPLHKGIFGRTPMFFAAPILGTLFPYVPLAQILGKDRPIYGLGPRGCDAGEEPFDTLPELAAYCVDGIRSVQAQGPYMVSGWSFGATVAFEIARQLEAQGQAVSLLAPIDLPAPGPANSGFMDFVRFFGGSMLRNILSYTRDYCYLKSRSKDKEESGYIWSLLERSVIAQVIPPEARKSFAEQPGIREILKLYKANIDALSSYRPPLVCQARIDLFRTADHAKRRHSEALGWEKATLSNAVVHRLPGDHMTILRPPFVEGLALAMAARLREIEGN